MKSFDDFLKVIDEEELSRITYQAACEQENDFLAISQSSQAFSLKLLRSYHEWLIDQLQSNDK